MKPMAPSTPISCDPLLDAEREEERGQEQRRDDEEETEVDEVLPEVRRAVGRGERLGAYGADLKSGCDRIEPRANRRLS